MVLETKSGLEGAVIGGGHSVAASRLDAQRSVAGWVSEQMGGLSYLFYIRDLVRHLSSVSCPSAPTSPSAFHAAQKGVCSHCVHGEPAVHCHDYAIVRLCSLGYGAWELLVAAGPLCLFPGLDVYQGQ